LEPRLRQARKQARQKADAHRDDGRRFVVRADEKLSAFIELERQVLTGTFHLESIRGTTNDYC
jgi:hypothetical protein